MQGDRIRLTRRVAMAAMAGFAPQKRAHRVDWFDRKGQVMNASHAMVTVKWDDRKTCDHWPPTALEKIGDRDSDETV